MSDLVSRLRNGTTPGTHLTWHVTPIHKEAADEIERLNALLTEACDALENLATADAKLCDGIDRPFSDKEKLVRELNSAIAKARSVLTKIRGSQR